jgi:hypothetical protein
MVGIGGNNGNCDAGADPQPDQRGAPPPDAMGDPLDFLLADSHGLVALDQQRCALRVGSHKSALDPIAIAEIHLDFLLRWDLPDPLPSRFLRLGA